MDNNKSNNIKSLINKLLYIIIMLPSEPILFRDIINKYSILKWLFFLLITINDAGLDFYLIYFLFYQVLYLYDNIFELIT